MNSGYYIFNMIELGALCVSAFRFFQKTFSFCSFNFWRIFRCDFLVEYKYFNLFVLACILQVILFLLMGLWIL